MAQCQARVAEKEAGGGDIDQILSLNDVFLDRPGAFLVKCRTTACGTTSSLLRSHALCFLPDPPNIHPRDFADLIDLATSPVSRLRPLLVSFEEFQAIIGDDRYGQWPSVLGSVQGIYLIADTKTGKLYVGRADGAARPACHPMTGFPCRRATFYSLYSWPVLSSGC